MAAPPSRLTPPAPYRIGLPRYASVVSLSLLGRRLHARGVPPGLAEWLRAHWHFPEHALPAHPFRIVLRGLDPPGPPPADASPCKATLPRLEIPCRTRGSTWWLGDEAGGLRLDLSDEGSRIGLWGAAPDAIYPTLFVALGESLRASGLLPLHAAVVVRDGSATALLGVPRVGEPDRGRCTGRPTRREVAEGRGRRRG